MNKYIKPLLGRFSLKAIALLATVLTLVGVGLFVQQAVFATECTVDDPSCPEFRIELAQTYSASKNKVLLTASIVPLGDRDGDGDTKDGADLATWTWFRYRQVAGSRFGCEPQHHQLRTDAALKKAADKAESLQVSGSTSNVYNAQRGIYTYGTGKVVELTAADQGVTYCFQIHSKNKKYSNSKHQKVDLQQFCSSLKKTTPGYGHCVEFTVKITQTGNTLAAKIKSKNKDLNKNGTIDTAVDGNSWVWFRYKLIPGSGFGCEIDQNTADGNDGHHGLDDAGLKAAAQRALAEQRANRPPSSTSVANVYNDQKPHYKFGTGHTLTLTKADEGLTYCFGVKGANYTVDKLVNGNKFTVVSVEEATTGTGSGAATITDTGITDNPTLMIFAVLVPATLILTVSRSYMASKNQR